MKRILSCIALTAALVAPTAKAADWNGIYAGGTLGSDSGEYSRFENDVYVSGPFVFEPGSTFGGFAGYNIQQQNLVFGGEVAYSSGVIGIGGSPEWNYDYMVDAKARAGYAAGNTLLYATIGGSFSTWNNNLQGPFAMQGISYGVGIDMLVSDSFFIGAEYLIRDLSADMTEWDGLSTTEHDLQTISIRAGMKF